MGGMFLKISLMFCVVKMVLWYWLGFFILDLKIYKYEDIN